MPANDVLALESCTIHQRSRASRTYAYELLSPTKINGDHSLFAIISGEAIMKISAGKASGLKAVSDEPGVIAALVMDQRSSLKKALGESSTAAQLEEFKTAVAEILTPHASAVLLDPEFGPQRIQAPREGRRSVVGL
jgi:hypothetical protein